MCLVFTGISVAIAADSTNQAIGASGLPVPRFVSIGVTRANLRVGPKQTHPILWEYQRKGLPLEIFQEHDSWRRVRDPEGETGWMHKQLLVGKRTGLVNVGWASIRAEPDELSTIIIRAEKGVVVDIDECRQSWCLVAIEGSDGWLKKENIWGVYGDEVFD